MRNYVTIGFSEMRAPYYVHCIQIQSNWLLYCIVIIMSTDTKKSNQFFCDISRIFQENSGKKTWK